MNTEKKNCKYDANDEYSINGLTRKSKGIKLLLPFDCHHCCPLPLHLNNHKDCFIDDGK